VRCGSPTLGRFDSCAAPLRREVRLALRASYDDFAAIVFRSGPQGPHPAKPDAAADGWTGSMKDRLAVAMIEGAERDRLISEGDTVVEYTGGSTGPARALVCRAKGYRALIVIADCFTEERMQLMRALGAELDVIPSVEGRRR
jgi:Pyridoxal-phosphate dependent enzyme